MTKKSETQKKPKLRIKAQGWQEIPVLVVELTASNIHTSTTAAMLATEQKLMRDNQVLFNSPTGQHQSDLVILYKHCHLNQETGQYLVTFVMAETGTLVHIAEPAYRHSQLQLRNEY